MAGGVVPAGVAQSESKKLLSMEADLTKEVIGQDEAIKKEDPNGTYLKNYDLGNFRTLFLAG